jgi:hypothetical protein
VDSFLGLKVSKTASRAELARQMIVLSYKVNKNETQYERFVELARSQRIALIISSDDLLEISTINCQMIVAIDDFVSIPIASMIAKNSPLQSSFEYG